MAFYLLLEWRGIEWMIIFKIGLDNVVRLSGLYVY